LWTDTKVDPGVFVVLLLGVKATKAGENQSLCLLGVYPNSVPLKGYVAWLFCFVFALTLCRPGVFPAVTEKIQRRVWGWIGGSVGKCL